MNRVLLAISRYLANVPEQVLQRKLLVLALFAVLTATFVYGMSKLKFDFTLEGWLQQDDAAFVAYNEFHDQFGSDDGVVIVYRPKDGNVLSARSLQAAKGIRDDLINYRSRLKRGERSALDHIIEVNCLINASVLTVSDDVLMARSLVGETVPTSPEELDRIRKTAESQRDFPLKYFSKDRKYAALYIKTDFGAVPVEADERPAADLAGGLAIDVAAGGRNPAGEDAHKRVTPRFKPTDVVDYVALDAAINQILNKPEYSRHLEYYKVGNTIDSENQVKMGKEMGVLYLAAAAIMLVCLLLIFRSLAGVVWPFLIIILSTIWTLGISGLAGIPASPFVVLTILLILTIGMADAIHIMSGYLFFRHEGHDNKTAIIASYEKAGLPCLLTATTNMAGVLSMFFTNLRPVMNFAVMSGLGVAIAFLLTIYLLPVLLELWSPAVGHAGPRRSIVRALTDRLIPNFVAALQRYLDTVVPAVAKRPLAYMIPFFVVAAICVYGSFKVRVDFSIYDQYSPQSNFYQSIKLMDARMAGSSRISMYVDLNRDNGFQDPAVLHVLEDLQQKLERNYPKYVVRASSIVDVVKDAYQKQNEGRPDMYVIPRSAQELSQTLFMFNIANPEEREKLVSENYRKANVTVALRTYGSYEYTDVFERMKSDINESFALLKQKYPQASVSITGIFAMGMTTADYLVVNELQSFGISVIVISLILLVVFNSLRAGVLAIIPNIIPSFLVLGLLGLLNIPLDFYTMMLAPIVVGISVDDTIHFVALYRSEVLKHGNVTRALTDSIKECGQAVVFTSMILGLGFGIMAVATTPGFSNLGKFGFLSIFSGLVCELYLTPALIMVFKLKFKYNEKQALQPAASVQVSH
jgi:predicted RND superfamily exporter protein